MAAGGFKAFQAGEVLDEDDINDYLMQGILVFGGTAARGSAIPAPVEGQFSFLSDSDTVEFYDGNDWVGLSTSFQVEYLIVAGGGGGGTGFGAGNSGAGGGGAGGYRNSYASETSGGSAVTEAKLTLSSGASIDITVGAGGASSSDGNSSFIGEIFAFGGGGGGNYPSNAGRLGGSGGGGAGSTTTPGGAGVGLFKNGRDGGVGRVSASLPAAGGGGGAGVVGVSSTADNVAGAGGAGLSSSITGSSVARGGGGGGGSWNSNNGAGGTGGGGNGRNNATGDAGTINTGGGGGGGNNSGGGAGGSGVVIIRYPASVSLTIGPGLTSTTTTSGSEKITSFTAGTDTVTF